MDLKKKSKAFSRLALKEKIFLLKKTKALATLGKELEKGGSLQIKLSKLVSDENLNDSPTTASQLKANKFYSHKIHEELSQVANRQHFLEKEAVDLRLSAGKTKSKVNKATEKAINFSRLARIELENKIENEQ